MIIKGDFKNFNQIRNIIKKIKIDTIIHLGAVTQVMDPIKTLTILFKQIL